MVYERYTVQGMSIGAITRLLNEQGVPTRKLRSRWERSTVWGMLRNPAYKGAACFGKTRAAPRQRVTRPLRLRGGIAARNSANHERPRDHWIEIPVPAIIDDATFALAQELLEAHKIHAPRRPASCRAWCPAASAAMPSTAPRPGRAHGRSTCPQTACCSPR
jgi:site-specific DNA recombinase